MGYFKWQGGFFYRVWHLNAKYYSNSTTTVQSVSLSILPLSALSLSLRYSRVSLLCSESSMERPMGQEASFPDIQMCSNIIPSQLVAANALHDGVTAAVSARISHSLVALAAIDTICSVVVSLSYSFSILSAMHRKMRIPKVAVRRLQNRCN